MGRLAPLTRILFVGALCFSQECCLGLLTVPNLARGRRPGVRAATAAAAKKEKKPTTPEEPSVGAKSAWFLTEGLGRVAAAVKGGARGAAAPPSTTEKEKAAVPRTVAEAVRRIERDYEDLYFIRGRMDSAVYAADCEFADPFVSFRGRQRFEENLANLAGGFIVDATARPLEATLVPGNATAPASIYKTRLLVKLRLALPWKPVLAWPWGVEHVIERRGDDFVVVRHLESWDVSAEEGLRQLFRPGPPSSSSSSSSSSSGKMGGSPPLGDDDDDDAPQGTKKVAAPSKLGTKDPIAGPLVDLARRTGVLPEAEADGWTGEPSEWADRGSLAQTFSTFSQRHLGALKQAVAEAVAGHYDAVAVDATLVDFIATNRIAMFSFTSCPFCKKAKELLDAKGADYAVFELDLDEDGAALRARLGARSGRTSVPSVWIDGAFVGGLNDGNPGLVPLDEKGQLDALLRPT